jgi:hypothetical protein
MIEELLGPGVQDGEHADGTADMAPIAGELDDGLGRDLHQHGVAVALVGAQHVPQFLGHSDGDVEIRDWQHLGAAGLEPPLGLLGVALGAAPILAGVIREHLGAAMVTAPDVSAEDGGSAVQNVGDGTLCDGGIDPPWTDR